MSQTHTRNPREVRNCQDCSSQFGVFHSLQIRCKTCQARYKNRRPKRYTVSCNRCSAQFHPRDTRSRTCASCQVAFPCSICGGAAKRSNPGKLYCSVKCSNLAKLIAKHGDINYLLALQRDAFKCRHCESTSALHVHHVDGHGLGHEREDRNNALDNLVTLCNPCHMKIHALTARALYANHRETVLSVFRSFVHSS